MYGGYYNKLAAFIPNAKGVWGFCLGGFKIFIGFIKCVGSLKIMFNSINRYISKIFA
ncbi:hypothetical protein JP0052_02710 [Helicobacter pylori]|nr:hypothetical protein JP0052_02710 [Helicobacter pylori]